MTTAAHDVAAYPADACQILTFRLGPHAFGIDILRVQELKGFSPITALPNAPAHVRGVMNLRGTIIPVVDLRARFGMPEGTYGKFTVIIVVTIGTKVVGLIVDAVADVLATTQSEIQPAPTLGGPVDAHLVAGLVQSGDTLVVLLEVDRVLAPDDLAALSPG